MEVIMMNKLSHKYVIKLLDYVEHEDNVYIVMEKPDQSMDLCNFINNKGVLSEHRARYFFQQLLTAIQYIHSEGVAHMDLKCENILFDIDEKQIKLIDFGWARPLTDVPLTKCIGEISSMHG